MTYSERFQDIAVTQLKTEGFEQLTDRQKNLAYHLAQAGLWGRYISLDQGSRYNIPMFRTLLALRNELTAYVLSLPHEEAMSYLGRSGTVYEQVHESLFLLFAHNGVYHSTTGEKLVLPLDEDDLMATRGADGSPTAPLVDTLKAIWFSDAIKAWRTVQSDGVDGVASSGCNFYEGLTAQEVKQWREANYPKHEAEADAEVPPYGFNERLSKDAEGNIQCEVVSTSGLYGPYVTKIVESLQAALPFAENEAQRASISTLITCYQSGSAADFDAHCVAWVKDQDSDVYFINGLIESYDDPLGIGCGFESIVAFKNPLQTAKVKKIIDHIQWFEDRLPIDSAFKKEKAQGLSASSITVVSMAGETAPSLPLGINLPNSDWIRSKHGSKSVNLENSASSRSAFEKPLREALYLPKYHASMEKYLSLTNGLVVDLHEIAGHGSGKVLPGVGADALDSFYAVIEECRADLVALYYIADEKLKSFGVFDQDVDVEEAARAQYVSYLTNGLFGQLRRIKAGQPLTQAHFRNRQLIASWVATHADPAHVAQVSQDGLAYVEVHDVARTRELFGQLLARIQEIKSTGDVEGARDLVMSYGTNVDQELLEQVHKRMASLNMPKTVCFVTPVLEAVDGSVSLSQVDNFFKQQVKLFETYCTLS